MKKLGKLSINQSKLLENEELVNLRGGYGMYGYGAIKKLYCYHGANPPFVNPQPCKWYPDTQSMVADVARICVNSKGYFSDC